MRPSPADGRRRNTPATVAAAMMLAGFAGLAGSADASAAAPAVAPAVANLQAQVLKIIGRTGLGRDDPAGVALQRVSLTDADPDAGPQGPLGLNNDPTTLLPGEAVTLRVNGTVVATAMPALRATALQTDAGTFTVLVFSAGGNSYALP